MSSMRWVRRCRAHDAARDRQPVLALDLALVGPAANRHDQGFGILRIEQRDIDVGEFQHVVDRVGRLLQQRLHRESGVDDPRHAGDQFEARGAATLACVASRVLDRDRRVARKHRQDVGCVRFEGIRGCDADAEEADQFFLPQDRNAEHLVLRQFRQRDRRQIAVACQHRFAVQQHVSGETDARFQFGAEFARGHVADRGDADHVLVRIVQADAAVVGPHEAAGVVDDALQQRIELEFAADFLNQVAQQFERGNGRRRGGGHAQIGSRHPAGSIAERAPGGEGGGSTWSASQRGKPSVESARSRPGGAGHRGGKRITRSCRRRSSR
jgi:hypothetical protein